MGKIDFEAQKFRKGELIPLNIRLLGGTKFNNDQYVGDPLFDSVVLPVTVNLKNTGDVSIKLSSRIIGLDLDSSSVPAGMLFMIVDNETDFPTDDKYRDYIITQLNSMSPSPNISYTSTYDELKAALITYNTNKSVLSNTEILKNNAYSYKFLFWMDYDKILSVNPTFPNENNGLSVKADNTNDISTYWLQFSIKVNAVQLGAPDNLLQVPGI